VIGSEKRFAVEGSDPVNALDVMKYGNLTFLGAVSKVPEAERETAGVCGYWSTKDLVAHLASYEVALVEALHEVAKDGKPIPTLERFRSPDGRFNDEQVEQRQNQSINELLKEYQGAHEQAMAMIAQLGVDKLREVGAIPWYGAEYSLEDFIVYAFYGHKREHSAQIAVFCDRFKG
jgi:hypothetical protein